jgi:hypothetical protein
MSNAAGRRSMRIARTLLFTLLFSFLSSAYTCAPKPFTVTNNTQETHTISTNEYPGQEVAPGKEYRGEYILGSPYEIVAKSVQGTVVYSKIYSGSELFRLRGRIVIQPPDGK